MAVSPVLEVALSLLALLLVVATVPFALTAITYRQRDNGLAYLLLVLGVGVWNGMGVAQLLSPQPLVKGFFLTLALVGAVLTGLGWFLFASTASRTPDGLSHPAVYGTVGALAGVDIVLTMTAPAHDLFWALPADGAVAGGFVSVVPGIGFWFHTALLALLFSAGAGLFAAAWADGNTDRYSRAYAIAGAVTALVLLASALGLPGQPPVASIAAGGLAAIGWVQAKRGRALAAVRSRLRSIRSAR